MTRTLISLASALLILTLTGTKAWAQGDSVYDHGESRSENLQAGQSLHNPSQVKAGMGSRDRGNDRGQTFWGAEPSTPGHRITQESTRHPTQLPLNEQRSRSDGLSNRPGEIAPSRYFRSTARDGAANPATIPMKGDALLSETGAAESASSRSDADRGLRNLDPSNPPTHQAPPAGADTSWIDHNATRNNMSMLRENPLGRPLNPLFFDRLPRATPFDPAQSGSNASRPASSRGTYRDVSSAAPMNRSLISIGQR